MDKESAVKYIFYAWGNPYSTKLTDDEEKNLPIDWRQKVNAHVHNLLGSSRRTIRFLNAQIVNFAESKVYYCRLCTEPVSKPAKYWHKDCWAAVFIYTSKYWKNIVRVERRRRGKICAQCLGSGRHQADHILPVALGGRSTAENLQFLCKSCHATKTKIDNQNIREAKKFYSSSSLSSEDQSFSEA